MATSIGSNFDYKGPNFLDARQGFPKSKKDLRNWSILVPEGFEIYLDGNWYIYDSNFNDPETGHFIPRFSDDVNSIPDKDFPNIGASLRSVAEMRGDIMSTITEITADIWPLQFKLLIGGGNYEQGQEVPVNIIWELTRKNRPVSASSVTVNGSTEGVTENKSAFTGPEITTNSDYVINIEAQNLMISNTIRYRFSFKRFFGTSSKSFLTSEDIINLKNSDFGTNNTLATTYFDCEGGKYPWFCIPTVIYNTYPFEVWVGGLQYTDLVISTINVTNKYGSTSNYTCVRFGNIQTGNLLIELK